MTSTNMTRWWLSAVLWSRSIASVATVPRSGSRCMRRCPRDRCRSSSALRRRAVLRRPRVRQHPACPRRRSRSARRARDRGTSAGLSGRRLRGTDRHPSPEDRAARCTMPWTDSAASSPTSPSIIPCQPFRNPSSSSPDGVPFRTIARMAAFRPGASPPPVRMPIRITLTPFPKSRTEAAPPRPPTSSLWSGPIGSRPKPGRTAARPPPVTIRSAGGSPPMYPCSRRRERGCTACTHVSGSSQGGFPSMVKKLKRH